MSPGQRQHRSALWPLAGPLLAELALGMSVSLVGLLLAAHESQAASGAFALANGIHATFFLLLRIVSLGVSVAITQELGADNRRLADATARAALGASTWVGVTTALSVALGAGLLLQVLSAPADVLPLARPYLQWLGVALGADALNVTLAAVLRAHLRARDVVQTILLIHAAHLALCWPLMHGVGPLPPLGLTGYALAMVLGRAVGIALYLRLWRRRLRLAPAREDWWRLRRAPLAAVLHIGLPGAAEGLAYRFALMATYALVAHMGTRSLATQAYAMQVTYFTVLPGLAIGLATEILVGRHVGARDLHGAERQVRQSLGSALVIATGMALLGALTARWTLPLFSDDAEVRALGTTLLWITVVLEPGRVFNLVVINALRAAGDARFPVAAGVGSMLLVMAGGAWLLGDVCGLGLAGVWIAYAADEWVRGLTMAWRWRRRHWLAHARAAHRRVAVAGPGR
ncbi:MAG: MATE family efflux transporter [Proteobacteria bacterium]|nr:MATE family efflux transporter [Pseudomonadota bacterium]